MNNDERHIIIRQLADQRTKTQLPSDEYFGALKNEIFGKIGDSSASLLNEDGAKVIPLYKRWWFVSSAAASIVFAIAMTFFLKQETDSAKAPDWNSVSKEDMYAYIENNISEFETEEVVSQLNEIPVWNTNVSFTGNPSPQNKNVEELFNELDKQEILEYLQEDVVEMDDEQITGN